MEIVQYHLLSNLVWKSELESILEAITAIPDNCLQVGDFNSDLHNLDKGTQDGRTLLDLLDIYDLYNLIGRFSFDQKYRDFRSETEWNGKSSG